MPPDERIARHEAIVVDLKERRAKLIGAKKSFDTNNVVYDEKSFRRRLKKLDKRLGKAKKRLNSLLVV